MIINELFVFLRSFWDSANTHISPGEGEDGRGPGCVWIKPVVSVSGRLSMSPFHG